MVVSHLPFRFYGIVGQLLLFRNRSFVLPLPLPRREPYYYFLQDGRISNLESASGVIIALENMPARRLMGLPINPFWFNRPEDLARFPHVTLDTTHIGTWGLDPEEVYRLLKERVVHVHLSNFDGKEHRSPADGHLRLAKFLQRLAHDGYRRAVSVETAPEALDAGDEGKCRAALEKALAFCREHFVPGKGGAA
jgi:sugar phosphate isomerase/epimerase